MSCAASSVFLHAGVVAHRRGAYLRIEATARHGARKENAKVRNRRLQKKVRCWSPQGWFVGSKFQPPPAFQQTEGNSLWLQYNGTATKPRLSVFCSNRQLYAMLVDDHGKKILFYASTLQEEICGDPRCSTVVIQTTPLRRRSNSHCICI